MAFQWLGDFLLQRAARTFASKLAPQLRRDYGIGAPYTAAQIRIAAGKCGLPRRYLNIGYAAFLPADEFRIVADVGAKNAYQQLRCLFFRYYVHESLSPAPAGTPAHSNVIQRDA